MHCPVTEWLIVWTADVLNAHKVRGNGKTAHEDMTGCKYKQATVGFGGNAVFKVATGKSRQRKFDDVYREGVVLGRQFRTQEVIIGTEEGLSRTRNN